MNEEEQYLQVGDIELRVKDIKILLEEHDNMKQDIKRLKEEYVMMLKLIRLLICQESKINLIQ